MKLKIRELDALDKDMEINALWYLLRGCCDKKTLRGALRIFDIPGRTKIYNTLTESYYPHGYWTMSEQEKEEHRAWKTRENIKMVAEILEHSKLEDWINNLFYNMYMYPSSFFEQVCAAINREKLTIEMEVERDPALTE